LECQWNKKIDLKAREIQVLKQLTKVAISATIKTKGKKECQSGKMLFKKLKPLKQELRLKHPLPELCILNLSP